MNDRYAKSKFSIAAEFLAGPESLCIRAAKAWTEVSVLKGDYEFKNPELQGDFDWLMSKMEQFAVGDGMKPKATDVDCDEVRKRILKINALFE